MAVNTYSPSTLIVFVVILSARILSAFYNNINDCDETYNYWEPAHFILHGTGFQTWEYSPVYAVRSYAYILFNAAPLVLLTSFSKIVQFYSLRVILALVCSVCETYFYSVIKRKMNSRISLWLFLFLVSNCGMYICSTAFLPSSFTMYCTMVSMAAWFDHKEHIAIFAVALGSILGWPFAAALGIPLAVNVILSQRRFLFFITWSFISLIIIGGPVLLIDSWLYGRVVFTPLNIILYNVFGKGGPDLYGTEPWTYYFINGFLNLNFSFVLCLLCFPLVELKIVSDRFIQKMPRQQQCQASIYRPVVLAVLIWIAIFFTRPHKEERFLFPIYPLVCLCAAISLHLLNDLIHTIEYIFRLSKSSRSILRTMGKIFTAFLLLTHAVMGVSRMLILYNGYSAPIKIYSDLSIDAVTKATQTQREVNLCVGKEWYRFPSSFFLPNKHLESRWKLRFIQSEFHGQLPKPYSLLPNATAIVPTDMNDMNKEEMSRYFALDSCHYLVDLESPVSTKLEPHYRSNTAVWEQVYSFVFLDSRRSPRKFRAFYIPWLSSELVKYTDYYLLRNTLAV